VHIWYSTKFLKVIFFYFLPVALLNANSIRVVHKICADELLTIILVSLCELCDDTLCLQF
jgi:hypothetical protein